jgi:hypothetical protein
MKSPSLSQHLVRPLEAGALYLLSCARCGQETAAVFPGVSQRSIKLLIPQLILLHHKPT